MTPDQEKEIQELKAKILTLTEQHPNLGLMMIVDARDYQANEWIFTGNLCPACAIENALQWALETGIQHNDGKLTQH